MKDPSWPEAMQNEIQALENNGTWCVTDLPPGKKALDSRWVYKIKYNSDSSLEHLKSQLVVFENHQVEGIDYLDTFSLVTKITTVGVFLVVAAAKNWELNQMDVHNDFLYGDLSEEMYMKMPPGFHGAQPGKICRL